MVELGNMTRAAAELFVAQPALSQQLTNLEADIGTRLLDRSMHGVSPTHAGGLFYKHAKAILRQVEDTRLVIRAEIESPSGEVTVAMPASFAKLIGVPLLRSALSHYPAISLKLIELPSAGISAYLARGEVDIAIGVDLLPSKNIEARDLLVEDLVAVFAKQEAWHGSSITLKQLAQFPLILPSRDNSIRWKVDTAFARLKQTYQLVAEINVTSLLALAALDGLGASVLPWSAIAEYVDADRLRAVPIAEPTLVRQLAICVPADVTPSPASFAIQAAIDQVCDELAESVAPRGIRMIKDRGRAKTPALVEP
jgi:LysR family nitrogen assimilation transcriptional regulator